MSITAAKPAGDGMRHIGILAHSAQGTALCFLEMVREEAALGERPLSP